jgi:serine/threonine-protein kinase
MSDVMGGRYVLYELLGQGAIAHVYRAFDQQGGNWVAVKRLRPGLMVSAALRIRFEREVQAMAALDHAHVVRIHDHGDSDGTLWIAMELVEGATLRHWMSANGPMPGRLAVEATLQVCGAIAAAHDQGFIHRDIKPHNVLVDPQGWCRVVDFGIARLIEDPGSLTRTGLTMGTWGYMSPEQMSDAKHVDVRTDIFALGALLLALLTGRDPARAGRDVTQLGEWIPEPLRWPLTRSTMDLPDHRYASAARFARTLVLAQENLPPLPPGTPSLHMPLDPVRYAGPTVVP